MYTAILTYLGLIWATLFSMMQVNHILFNQMKIVIHDVDSTVQRDRDMCECVEKEKE